MEQLHYYGRQNNRTLLLHFFRRAATGFATPWIFDYPQGRYRKPTAQDQVDMIRLGEALPSVAAVNAPLICGDFDARIETIESARLLLLNTTKPGWAGTGSGREVKYLAELAALAVDGDRQLLRTRPPIFVAAYCTTSPLKLDTRSCEVLEEALKYDFPVNFAPMPMDKADRAWRDLIADQPPLERDKPFCSRVRAFAMGSENIFRPDRGGY